jgi:hypothetical protein
MKKLAGRDFEDILQVGALPPLLPIPMAETQLLPISVGFQS